MRERYENCPGCGRRERRLFWPFLTETGPTEGGSACLSYRRPWADGLCAPKCPVGAIAEEKPKRTDKKKCISCMRCIEICPNGARGCSPLMEDLT